MADSFQTILDYRELSASYRQAPTLLEMPFTDNFFKNPTPTTADEVTTFIVGRINQPAQGNTRGGNPRQMAGPSANKKQFSLFHSFNELMLDANTLRFLRATDPSIQEIGRQLIADTIDEAGRRQRLFREIVISQIMTVGKVYLDAAGNILVPTVDAVTGVVTAPAGAVIAADYQVADSHRGNLGALVGAASPTPGLWDTNSTDMFSQLAAVRDAALKQSAEVPTEIYMHRTHIPSLIQNSTFKTYAQFNNLRNEDVLRGSGVDNLYGWNFHFIDGYWTDLNGVQRPIIPTKQVIMTPKGGDWMRCKEGTQDIPTTVGIVDSLEAALATLKPVVGMFSFAQVRVSPLVQLSLYLGDNFGCGFMNPNAVWMPTVFSA